MLGTLDNTAVVNAEEAKALDICGEEPREEPVETPARPGYWRRTAHLWILLGLTVFSGFLRFYWIDRPSLWNDEAHTYRRVTGDFLDTLDTIATEGFAPLLYEWYYFLAQRLGGAQWLTPFWMRFVPCLFGTLMTPAMYFLARQLCSKRTSLVAAAIATCSAYLMVYAHDTKMYMPLLCLVATNVGCLLWWFRSGLRVSWLAWMASGVMLAGTHAPGLMVLAMSPLMFLTQPRIHWKRLILFLLGLAVVGSAPYVHYTYFDSYKEQLDDTSWSEASGIGWSKGILSNRDDPNLLRYATGAYLYSWEWPSDTYSDTDIQRRQRNTRTAMSTMLQGFCIDPKLMALLKAAIVVTIALAALGLMPWPARWRGVALDERPPNPWGLSMLWLCVWIVVPTYYFYLTTSKTQSAPSDWGDAVASLFGGHWYFLAAQIILVMLLCVIWRKLPLMLVGAMGLIVLLAFNVALFQSGLLGANRPVWWQWPDVLAGYLGQYLGFPLALGAALVLLPPVAWYYCDKTVLGRSWKTIQALACAAVVIFICVKVHQYYKTDLAPSKKNEWTPMFVPRYFSVVWPAVCIVLAVLLMRLPTRPLRWGAVALVIGVNLFQVFHRFNYGEPPIDHVVADMYGMPGDPTWHFGKRWRQWQGKEQPPIRSTDPATLTFVSELASGGGSGGGPGRDVAWTAHPGGGRIEFRAGKYYISVAGGSPYTALEFKELGLSGKVQYPDHPGDAGIVRQAANNSKATRIIVWDRTADNPVRQVVKTEVVAGKVKVTTDRAPGYRVGEVLTLSGVKTAGYDGKVTVAEVGKDYFTFTPAKLPEAPGSGGEVRPYDTLIDALGPQWKAKSEFYIPVLYHWNWSELYTARRREYVRG